MKDIQKQLLVQAFLDESFKPEFLEIPASIQKAIESRRITDLKKEYLKTLKRLL